MERRSEPDVTPDWSVAPRVPGPLAVASPVDRLLGTAVHAALARWQRAVDGGAPASAAGLLEAARAEVHARGIDLVQAGAAWSRAEAGLRWYASSPWPRRATLYLEQAVHHRLDAEGGFAVELELRVDRVARYQGSVAILDFKTVTPHAAERLADEWQLRTYALAAPELLGVDSTSVALFIIDIGAGAEVPVDSGRDALAAAAAELLAAARGIAAAEFEVGPEHPDRPCWDCGFRLECPSSRAPRPPGRRGRASGGPGRE